MISDGGIKVQLSSRELALKAMQETHHLHRHTILVSLTVGEHGLYSCKLP